ncbi:MAG: hypothetical protein KDA93_11255 [Planctomycetaceae bacterium]|nr:hypothetical protein [Planctomycetaceae bacterium]
MKSEHRHELAENDLSKLLGNWAQQLDEHQNTILSVAVVIALVAAGLIYWTRMSNFEQSSGWAQLTASSSPEDFANIAEAHEGSTVGEWALLRAADGFLQEGIRLSISDRPASNDRLEQAQEAYQELTSPGTLPVIREQALNGYAVTLESRSDGDTQPALAAYENLLKAFPETRFKQFAEDRIESLKTGGTQDFYAWFHQQNPQPADMPLPKDGPTGGSDPLGSLVPDLDLSDLESTLGDLKLGDEPFTPPVVPDGDQPTTEGESPNPFEPPATDDTPEPETVPAPSESSDETTPDDGDDTTPPASE